MSEIRQHDLAILTARAGATRAGAVRAGFVLCPEDVEGVGTDEPGEYVWKETLIPSTDDDHTEWTLEGEDCNCRNLCTVELGDLQWSPTTPGAEAEATLSIPVSGVLGLIGASVRISWGDAQHDVYTEELLESGTSLEYTHTYLAEGTYTVTVELTDERGCQVTATGDVTVAAGLDIDVTAVQVEDGLAGEATVEYQYAVSGGTAPYTYSLDWTGGGDAGPDTNDDPIIIFTGTPLDTETIFYTLTVTDDLGVIGTFNGSIDVTYNES